MGNIGKEIRLDLSQLSLGGPPFKSTPHQRQNMIYVKGFGNVVERSQTQSLNSGVKGTIAGNNDGFDVAIILLDFFQNIDSGKAGHFEIQSDEIYGILAEDLNRLSSRLRQVNVVIRVENHLERFSRTHLIIDEQNVGLGSLHALLKKKQIACHNKLIDVKGKFMEREGKKE